MDLDNLAQHSLYFDCSKACGVSMAQEAIIYFLAHDWRTKDVFSYCGGELVEIEFQRFGSTIWMTLENAQKVDLVIHPLVSGHTAKFSITNKRDEAKKISDDAKVQFVA